MENNKLEKSKQIEKLEEYLSEVNLKTDENALDKNSNTNQENKYEEINKENNSTLNDKSFNEDELDRNEIKKESNLQNQNKQILKKEKSEKREPKTFRKNLYSCFFKRFFDVLLSGIALIILSPVMLVVAILVRCKLGKGVIFKQWRLTKGNKPFKLYKFRTMKNAYGKNGELLPDDQRITKFGTMLRKTSLDELPQLWNIFIGNMSIIGPRPRMIQECVFLDDESLKIRSYVRPGLTGLAQVNGRNNITFDKVVEYDKKYVKSINLWLDTKIFFKTIGKVFKSEDVNKNGTVSNEFYGDMLLRTGAISQEQYDEKQNLAKDIIRKAG